MHSYPLPPKNTRIGFHYFPDTIHFRELDLQAWIPELSALGASWLVLRAPTNRAIPEPFINGLIKSGIEPILHFSLRLGDLPIMYDITTLLSVYQKWGVHYVTFFDRPNSRKAWSASAWAQEDLVERFLDRFIPLARIAIQFGLNPVFPPLDPAGDYWDTSFLEIALTSLLRRKEDELVQNLVLSAYSWSWDRSLNWGAGGPERWPGSHPYFTPATEEDQCGFRIFDWYLAISRSVFQRSLPILCFGAGRTWDHNDTFLPTGSPVDHATTNLSIVQLMSGETLQDPTNPEQNLEPVPDEILATNLWVLAASSQGNHPGQAWFQPDGQTLPVVGALRQYRASRQAPQNSPESKSVIQPHHSIKHYLLLPSYEWGVSDYHLDVIRPYLKKYRPTVGFSLQEAINADQVTVIGNENSFSENDLTSLRSAGCQVERIGGDGTQIATILSER
jgi:hypothetical protein